MYGVRVIQTHITNRCNTSDGNGITICSFEEVTALYRTGWHGLAINVEVVTSRQANRADSSLQLDKGGVGINVLVGKHKDLTEFRPSNTNLVRHLQNLHGNSASLDEIHFR